MTLLTNERGSALIITLMCTMLLTALGVALVLTTSTETLITANYKSSHEVLYAADAGIERSIQDLLRAASWNAVLTGTSKSGFVDSGAGTLPDGTKVDLAAMTSTLQKDTDATYGLIPNRPVWRVYSHAPMSDLLPGGAVTTRGYVVVWVADDPAENDGNPLADTNGLITVRAEAHGTGGTRKAAEATISALFAGKTDDGYIGQRGQDELNRGRRRNPVGTPGTTLTEMRMDVENGDLVVQ